MERHVEKPRRIPALEALRGEFVRVAQAEARSSGSRRLRRPAFVLAGLVLVVAAATATGIILTSGADEETARQGPAVGFEASGPRYASLAELVAKADLVVVGTVQEVLPPEVIETEDPEYPTRVFNAVVRVDEVLKGSAPSAAVIVKTLELAFSGPGPEEWRKPGERVLLFLSPSRETTGLYILANTNYSQTAYIIQGEDVRATVGDRLSEKIAALSLPEVSQAVRVAP